MSVFDDMVREVAGKMGTAPQKPAMKREQPERTSVNQAEKSVAPSMNKPIRNNERVLKMTASGLSVSDYPLAEKQAHKIKGLTGKKPEDITLDAVMEDHIAPEDIRISPEVLNMQADIAESNGKRQFADSLRRAAEMTRIPDERVLDMYNLLRPNRATRTQLEELAQELEQQYDAKMTAAFVRDAAEAYAQRDILLK